jgi:hypothetical protein
MFSSSLSSMNKARMVLDISTCVPNKALEITSLTRPGLLLQGAPLKKVS